MRVITKKLCTYWRFGQKVSGGDISTIYLREGSNALDGTAECIVKITLEAIRKLCVKTGPIPFSVILSPNHTANIAPAISIIVV